jgi:hypothetical protein
MRGHDDRMPGVPVTAGPALPHRSRLSGWFGLGVGLGVVWILAYVLLPWVASLSPVRPVMEALAQSGADASQYFYTQSEETAVAQMYVRNALSTGRDGARP